MELTAEMSQVKTLLDAINLQVVTGKLANKDYNAFLKSLNRDLPPNFRIRKVK